MLCPEPVNPASARHCRTSEAPASLLEWAGQKWQTLPYLPYQFALQTQSKTEVDPEGLLLFVESGQAWQAASERDAALKVPAGHGWIFAPAPVNPASATQSMSDNAPVALELFAGHCVQAPS